LYSERLERRLTAILAADAAGYSRLIGMDEEGTHAQLQDHLSVPADWGRYIAPVASSKAVRPLG
jgi:hypothetical protein